MRVDVDAIAVVADIVTCYAVVVAGIAGIVDFNAIPVVAAGSVAGNGVVAGIADADGVIVVADIIT